MLHENVKWALQIVTKVLSMLLLFYYALIIATYDKYLAQI